ncbi:MAG: hypothetical protein FJ087_18250 [Deltaproteobacteria bacterium]|nr:hypothetical protein [Deltaproteobacteria bacterium]
MSGGGRVAWVVVCCAAAATCACGAAAGGDDPGPDAREAFSWPDVDLDAPPEALPDARDDSSKADAADVESAPPVELPVTVPLPCEAASDCLNPCGPATCGGGRCSVTTSWGMCFVTSGDEGTCYGPLQVGRDETCMLCNPDVARDRLVPIALTEPFEAALEAQGVSVEDLSDGGIVWQLSEERFHSGKSSLYFGDPAAKTYANGRRAAAAARLPPVRLPEGSASSISFHLWLATEETEGYDVFTVRARAGEDPEVVVFSSDSLAGTTQGRFLPMAADLSAFAGRTVALSLVFDSLDHGMNSFEGAYVDDLRVTTGCCAAAADCDDDDPCTDDSCGGDGKGCAHERREACCNRDAECSDGDACTADRCSAPGGTCEADPIEDCCHTAADCDDGDDCTEDTCPGDGGRCEHRPACCDDEDDCVAPDPCMKGTCDAGKCSYVDTCCHSDQACEDGDPCTLDVCDGGACDHRPANVPGCCFPTVCEHDFEGSVEDWAFDPAVDGIGWQVSMERADEGLASLYYGDPVEMVFNKGGVNSGSAVSPVIALPGGIDLTLSFRVWMDTEGDWWTTDATLQVYLLSEGKEYVVWSMGSYEPQQEWAEVSEDVTAFGGREVQLRFDFSSKYYDWALPAASAAGEGVFIDSIAVTSSCAAKGCDAASDCPSLDPCLAGGCIDGQCSYAQSCCMLDVECDDGDLCTQDSCGYNDRCSFVEIAGCCMGEGDCKDANPCTVDTCSEPGGQCGHVEIPGCCQWSNDCDDEDDCTKDLCLKNECVHEDFCCVADPDCDDGDDVCTTDLCVGGFCKHLPTGVEGCCPPVVLSTSFEGGDGDFALDEPKGGVGWHLTDGGKAFDGDWALYYGDPEVWDFDNGGINSGDAASPQLDLPANSGISLSFRARLDTEDSGDYDVLSVLWVEGETEYQLWRKSDSTVQDKFFLVTIDMSGFAGRTGAVVFRFDTIDGTVNASEGVYVDQVELASTCAPVECAKSADCDDESGYTDDTCVAGACSYELVDPECTSDSDCYTWDYCLVGSCVAGQCEYVEDPYCWW